MVGCGSCDEKSFHHSFEAAARIIHNGVIGNVVQERDLRLKLAQDAFDCLARRGEVNRADMEVWCAMVGVRIDSDLDVKARIVPIFRAAALARGAETTKIRWDELSALTLSAEAGAIETVLGEARLALSGALRREATETGRALIAVLAARCGIDACEDGLSRRQTFEALYGFETGPSRRIGLCGACAQKS